MAMTKKFRVTFDVTAVINSEHEKNIVETATKLAKKAAAGEELSDMQQEMLVQALTYGPEGLAAFLLKQGLRDFIKFNHRDLCESEREMMRFSPATVTEVK